MERVSFGKAFMSAATIAFVIIILSGKKCGACFSAPVMAGKFILAGAVFFFMSYRYYIKFKAAERILFKVERQPVLSAAKATEDVPYSTEGTIIPTGTLVAPISKRECVYYHIIRERYENQGKSSAWIVRENTMKYLPFYVEDRNGRLLVDMLNMDSDFSKCMLPAMDPTMPNPNHSEVDAICTVKEREYKIDKKMAADERWRESEYILEPNKTVFAYGMVCSLKGERCLREAPEYPLIISRKNKDKYISEFFGGPSMWYSSVAIALVGVLIFMSGMEYYMPGTFMLGVLAAVGLLCADLVIRSHNRVVLLKQRTESALSEISIWSKKRRDLIPQLETIVNTYAKHEKGLFELIASMRADLLFYPLDDKGAQKSLIGILEAYPTLKANQNFKSLMITLEDTEESIAQSREFYNRTVLKYNNFCQQFPTMVMAMLLGMKPMKFMDRYELK